MLLSEELPRDLGAHLRPQCREDRIVSQLSACPVLRGNPLRHLDPEGADLAGVNLERRAQLDRCPDTCGGQVGRFKLGQPLCGEGMHAGAEEGPHLFRGHCVPGAEAISAGYARADPRARTLSPFGVVGRQSDVALLGGIQRRDLPSQVVIPRPGAELVDAHRHNP